MTWSNLQSTQISINFKPVSSSNHQLRRCVLLSGKFLWDRLYVCCCVYSRMPWIWQPAFAITLACYCCRRLWKMATGLAYTLHKFRHKLEIVVTFMAWKPIVMRIAPPELCCCCRYITQQLHTNEAQLRCWCHTIFCELKSSAAIRRRNGGDCYNSWGCGV